MLANDMINCVQRCRDDTRSRKYKKLIPETCTEWNAALFLAIFLYQKLSNTANQSNRTIMVTCIGASLWYKVLVVLSVPSFQIGSG